MSFEVGNGQRVTFWIKKCCGDTPLEYLVPLLVCYFFLKGGLGMGCLEGG